MFIIINVLKLIVNPIWKYLSLTNPFFLNNLFIANKEIYVEFFLREEMIEKKIYECKRKKNFKIY